MKSSFAARWGHPRRLKAIKADSRVRKSRPKQVWVWDDKENKIGHWEKKGSTT